MTGAGNGPTAPDRDSAGAPTRLQAPTGTVGPARATTEQRSSDASQLPLVEFTDDELLEDAHSTGSDEESNDDENDPAENRSPEDGKGACSATRGV